MCKVIAVAMQKGGCAKTSVSLNLGIGLARAGKKVLLIDNDPQGNLTASLGYEEPDDMSDTLASVMMKIINEEPIEPGYGILHHQEGIDLIPGNIELSGLEVLEGFFQRNFHGKKSISISAARFEKALKDSRFGSLSPKEVLELYFREEMAGKKQRRQEEKQRWSHALEEIKEMYGETPVALWLMELEQEKNEFYFYLRKRYREAGKDKEEIKAVFRLGSRILNGLPYRQNTTEYLAVFAAMMTGNPHAFDDGEREGAFLRLLIQWDIVHRDILIDQSDIFPALQRQRLYLAAGILRDDMSNYAMLFGVRAWKKNGELHEGMNGFCHEKNPVQVPLSVIADWGRVECPGREIYIVENPSVFAMLCEKRAGKKGMYVHERVAKIKLSAGA